MLYMNIFSQVLEFHLDFFQLQLDTDSKTFFHSQLQLT